MRVVVSLAALLGFSGSVSADTNGLPETTVQPEVGTAEIVGGTLAPANKWPDAVAVLGAQGACTGTLIAPDVVLTAGHCVGGMTQVIANTTDYNAAGGARATIKTHTAYPNWETTYDVSVIVLNTPLTGVTPRPVATTECTMTTFNTKPTVQLVGFGATDINAQAPNTKLYEVSVPVTDAVGTTAGLGFKPAVAPGGEFGAGDGAKDSCNGDSGGPVYLNTPRGYVVIGAVSRAYDNATQACGQGGIYVRADKILAWIETTTGKTVSKDNCAAPPPSDPNNPNNPDDPNNPNNPNDPNNPESSDVTGGCSTTGHSAGAGFLLVLGFALIRRRRR
jgi:MYXO-CTERM domain-containing protein